MTAEDPTGLDTNSQNQVKTPVLSLFVRKTDTPRARSSLLWLGKPVLKHDESTGTITSDREWRMLS
jgi:hypothetical protein